MLPRPAATERLLCVVRMNGERKDRPTQSLTCGRTSPSQAFPNWRKGWERERTCRGDLRAHVVGDLVRPNLDDPYRSIFGWPETSLRKDGF